MNAEKKSRQFTAIIDSGVGGISVLAQAHRMLPQENFLFFADYLHAPYGDRQTDEIIQLMEKHCSHFAQEGAKAILIACNTATSAAASHLRSVLSIPILGMEPALKPAVQEIDGQVLVLATSLTIREEKFQNLLAAFAEGKNVIPLACPGLMELVEKDPAGSEAKDYLSALLHPYQASIKAIVLGCTHYVFLRPLLRQIVPQAALYDGNEGVCRHLADVLKQNQTLGGDGKISWDCSVTNPKIKSLYLAKCQSLFQYISDIIDKN